MSGIGELNEKPLHASLKAHYRLPGGREEVPFRGFVIDLVQGGRLVEIQTAGFSSMHRKLDLLLDDNALTVVHPVPVRTWILEQDADGGLVSRRRSPKRGIPADVCAELVSFPSLLDHPNFEVEVALVEVEEVRRPARGKRRRFSVEERRLVHVVQTVSLRRPADLLQFLPAGLPDPFTTADLAAALGRPRRAAQAVAYCLRVSGAVQAAGRDKRGVLHHLPAGD